MGSQENRYPVLEKPDLETVMQGCWTIVTTFVCDSDPIAAKCNRENNGSGPILKIFHLYQCRISLKSAVGDPGQLVQV